MSAQKPSPRIVDISWGKIEVEGNTPFIDAKLYPGGASAWDWGRTGTRHVPGIQLADVSEILSHGATIIILSQGVHQFLQTHPSTIRILEEKGVTVHHLPTPQAAELYNQLCDKGEPVGALMHTTC